MLFMLFAFRFLVGVLVGVLAMTGAIALAVAASAAEADGTKAERSGRTIGLLCTWAAYETEKESFVIDTGSGSLYWVNQNQMMQVEQFNSGRLVAEGVRSRLKVAPQKFEEKISVRMIFDRISGDFLVLQDAYQSQAPGSCQTRRAF